MTTKKFKRRNLIHLKVLSGEKVELREGEDGRPAPGAVVPVYLHLTSDDDVDWINQDPKIYQEIVSLLQDNFVTIEASPLREVGRCISLNDSFYVEYTREHRSVHYKILSFNADEKNEMQLENLFQYQLSLYVHRKTS